MTWDLVAVYPTPNPFPKEGGLNRAAGRGNLTPILTTGIDVNIVILNLIQNNFRLDVSVLREGVRGRLGRAVSAVGRRF